MEPRPRLAGSAVRYARHRPEETLPERHRAMSWAQRRSRVFKLDLASCEGCGGQVRVIACLEDPVVIGKILAHLAPQRPTSVSTVPPLPPRGPPRQGVLERR